MKWKRGEKSRLAEAAGVKLAHVTDIAMRRRCCGKRVALRLDAASKEVLGKRRAIPWTAWMGVDSHPMLECYSKIGMAGDSDV